MRYKFHFTLVMETRAMRELREREFPQLEQRTFLDFAGSMVLCKSQVERFGFLANECLANPHTYEQVNRSANEIECLRAQVLASMNLDLGHYACIFTKNTTEALHILGRHLRVEGDFFYTVDNHNSVLGLAEMLKERDVAVEVTSSFPEDVAPGSVFAFPVQSNATGRRYPLKWIREFQELGGMIVLDAAATTLPDLCDLKPDFITLSLLKVCGAHGGCLVVRRDRESKLSDPPPAGGALLFSCSRTLKFQLLPFIQQKFESGTLAFTDLLIALEGLKVRRKFGTEDKICEHLRKLSDYFVSQVADLKHKNGVKLVQFVPERVGDFGATFAFNLVKDDGNIVNHHSVQFIFSVFGIVARFGSHCNPGATYHDLGWDADEVEGLVDVVSDGTKCVSSLCVVDGRPVGTIRVSFGYPTTFGDIDKLVSVLGKMFVNGGPSPSVGPLPGPITIKQIFVFPLTGARGYEVSTSKLDKWGLIHDRNWKLISEDGRIISTPQCPALATLVAKVVGDSMLQLNYRGNILAVDIDDFEESTTAPPLVRKYGRVYGDDVSAWICHTLGRFAYLVKVHDQYRGKMAFSGATEDTCRFMGNDFDIQRVHINLVFTGIPIFTEEGQPTGPISMAGIPITVWRTRPICMTTSLTPDKETVDVEGLRKLAEARATYGTTPFGVLFGVSCDTTRSLRVGDKIQ